MTGILSPDVPEPAEALARWLADPARAHWDMRFTALHPLRSMQRATPFVANRAAREVLTILSDGSTAEAMATHREALGLDGPHGPHITTEGTT